MKTQEIALAEIVEDFDLYPRASVDSTHVSHIALAIEAGVELPLPILEAESKRIVDGFHRVRAYKRLLGKEGKITVELRHYDNDGELFLEALRLNAGHGHNLTAYDRKHSVLLALKLNLKKKDIAAALNMPLEKVQFDGELTCANLDGRLKAPQFCLKAMARTGEHLVPLKYPVRHLAGQTLNARQTEVVGRMGGNGVPFLAHQLTWLLNESMIDESNESVLNALVELEKALKAFNAAKKLQSFTMECS